ncbi:MAG: hypothetical protein HUU54_14385 [Ignavibacteriaceae bacterium]|nr:hypothetical protein [Ignavibacteriaceae bacterium]
MCTRRSSVFDYQPLTVVTLMFVLVLFSSAFAQKPAAVKMSNAAIGNLVNALNSENDGLRRSAIYLAGKNKVKEVVDVLIERLNKEKEAGMKILTALSLYNIGDNRGMEKVHLAAVTDPDLRVRRMCTAIFSEYLSDNNYNSANLLNEF